MPKVIKYTQEAFKDAVKGWMKQHEPMAYLNQHLNLEKINHWILK